MGLGLYVGAETTVGTGRGKRGAKKLFVRIEQEIRAALGDPLLERLASFSHDEQTLAAHLHPAEEPAEFTLGDDGCLVCSAKTSSAGPGYHAMLVDLLGRLESPCELAWQWDNEEREFMDETGFAGHRDYRLLQVQMLKLLRATARLLLRDKQHERLALSVPAHYQVTGDYYARSPLGFWERSWFEKVAAAEPEQLSAQGAEFYPWWNRQQDALSWRNCGLVKAWVELPWHAPADAAEAENYEVTLECIERARSLDPKLRLPDAEIAEVRRLLNAPGDVGYRPASKGVGFRRRVLWRYPYVGWRIQVPGYFYEADEDRGATALYWHGDKTIRLSTWSVKGKRGRVPPAEELGTLSPDEVPADAKTFDCSEEGRFGQAVIQPYRDEIGQGWMLQGRMATPGHLGFVTICYDERRDQSWALQTWRSIRGPEESSDDD